MYHEQELFGIENNNIKSQRKYDFSFFFIYKNKLLINNDYSKSINKATITHPDICGGSGNLSWELLKITINLLPEKNHYAA